MGQFHLEQIIAYVFVVDGMNFCFWPNNPAGQYEYEHMTRKLERLLLDDPEFFTAKRLSNVNEHFLKEHVFPEHFALVDERARLLR